jgi:hypothetical protein
LWMIYTWSKNIPPLLTRWTFNHFRSHSSKLLLASLKCDDDIEYSIGLPCRGMTLQALTAPLPQCSFMTWIWHWHHHQESGECDYTLTIHNSLANNNIFYLFLQNVWQWRQQRWSFE